MTLLQLKRIRWAVRLVLALGVAASIAGNVLHARESLISQIISAWSPLALLLTVELISRVPVHRRALAFARWAATAVIAGIAAWVSYWHMAAVAAHYGETGAAPYLLPLSVDGLIVVASICLVELGGRIAAAIGATTPAPATVPPPAPPADPVTTDAGDGTDQAGSVTTAQVTAPAVPDDVKPRPARSRPKTLTSAEKVARAAAKLPGATPAQIAAKAGVSESTARRHLTTSGPVPVASPTGPDAAETAPAPATNGRHPDLIDAA
ncbi:DUF2637 domain-containing protein [Plantactinospora sp. WMMB782]|uniref:DUF2637 domain-containing protein n=1 Tax=Plantactinospora sp. WMMB782 TaxID=3404121 RepID=UPI003B93B81E